jgi:hypothetical protein
MPSKIMKILVQIYVSKDVNLNKNSNKIGVFCIKKVYLFF